jgi:hypothetical protein
MPIPPGDERDYDRLVDDLARRLAAQIRPGQTAEMDLPGAASQAGVQLDHLLARMQEVVAEEGKLSRMRERDEERLSRLRERAEASRTPEGRSRMAEEAGLRGQIAASRYAAAEPMGPPRQLFREQERRESRAAREDEREGRAAAAARRYAAGIAEREEARAARAAEREDREAAAARRFGARIAEQEEAKAARAAGPMGPPRELFRAQERKEADAEKAKAEAERERSEILFGRTRLGSAMAMGALSRSGMFGGGAGALMSGAAGALSGAALGGVPGVIVGLSAVVRGMQEAQESQLSYAAKANPSLGATVEASREMADVSYGARAEVQDRARKEAIFRQAQSRYEANRSLATYDEMLHAGYRYAATGKMPDWFKEDIAIPGVRARAGVTGEEYYQGLAQAGLEGAGQQLSNQILQKQLETMQMNNRLLDSVRDNTADIENMTPAWR